MFMLRDVAVGHDVEKGVLGRRATTFASTTFEVDAMKEPTLQLRR
ncbi:hypothetical protein [Acuticoccus sp.]